MAKKKIFDKETLDYILNEYKNGRRISSIRKELKTTALIISKILKQNQIMIRPGGHETVKCNENYFSKIDTEAKAYLLGWMYSDGCILDKGKKSKRMTIKIQEGDIEILELFKKELEFEGKIEHKNEYNTPKHHKKRVALTITSNKLCNDLIALGCTPRKSLTLQWPRLDQVPQEFIRPFILGIFDGDGCITSVPNPNDSKFEVFQFGITGTKSICDNINLIISKLVELPIVKLSPAGKAFSVHRGGNRTIRKIYNYLYPEATVFLSRKKTKMSKIFDQRHYIRTSKYPGVGFYRDHKLNNWRGTIYFYSDHSKYERITKYFPSEEAAHKWVQENTPKAEAA